MEINSGQFKKGIVPWNKGKILVPLSKCSICNTTLADRRDTLCWKCCPKGRKKGYKHSDEWKQKMSEKCKKIGTGKWNKGRKLSDETKKKISENNSKHFSGKHLSPETIAKIREKKKGQISWNKGLKIDRTKYPQMGHFGKHTKETKILMSINSKGKNLGKKHFNWKGGISKNKVHLNWQKNQRNRVIKRLRTESLSHTFGEWEDLKAKYGFACPCCKISEPEIKLTEDHIVPLSKGGSDLIENIQPLCLKCNMRKHTKIIRYIYE